MTDLFFTFAVSWGKQIIQRGKLQTKEMHSDFAILWILHTNLLLSEILKKTFLLQEKIWFQFKAARYSKDLEELWLRAKKYGKAPGFDPILMKCGKPDAIMSCYWMGYSLVRSCTYNVLIHHQSLSFPCLISWPCHYPWRGWLLSFQTISSFPLRRFA